MRRTIIEDYTAGARVIQNGHVLGVDLLYPRTAGHLNTVEVGIEDVRAADTIRIAYDYDRDGYAILQASVFGWSGDDSTQNSDWQEVAFIQAWGRVPASSEGDDNAVG